MKYEMKKAFVIGWPIHHSKSPLLHRFWLDQYDITGSYEAVAVEPGKAPDFLKSFQKQGFVGGNITLPHKDVAFQTIENRDKAATSIEAVNTVWHDGEKLFASNTDAYGFAANMDDYADDWRDRKSALVLGAGGASKAVVLALCDAGFSEIHIINRTLSRAQALALQFGAKVSAHEWFEIDDLLPKADFLVNTTSLGMKGSEEIQLPDFSRLNSETLVTDIVYTPLETPLLLAAKQAGLKTVDGLGMLLHQAVPGFERWFGRRPEVTKDLRNHILEAL